MSGSNFCQSFRFSALGFVCVILFILSAEVQPGLTHVHCRPYRVYYTDVMKLCLLKRQCRRGHTKVNVVMIAL